MSTFRISGLKGSHQDSNGNEGAPDSEGSAESGTVPGDDLVGASGFPSLGAPVSNSLLGVGAGLLVGIQWFCRSEGIISGEHVSQCRAETIGRE